MTTMFDGKSIHLLAAGEGIIELHFEPENDAANPLDEPARTELLAAAEHINSNSSARGVLITSAEGLFTVGANIKELGDLIKLPEAEIGAFIVSSNDAINAIETLRVPTVAVIDGATLGCGLEVALAADFRVSSSIAQVGLPEVKLGLVPRFGGTVRLPRLAGAQLAIDWISSGSAVDAEMALAAGVVDQLSERRVLRSAAISLLAKAIAGAVDWRARRAAKFAPLTLPPEAGGGLFAAARAKVAAASPKHQPAALAAVDLMERASRHDRDQALAFEAATFAKLAKTQAAGSLLQFFKTQQILKKRYREHARNARSVKQAAVLGAGIMGGGIAYTSAVRGTPVRMKDINEQQLQLGLSEVQKLLGKQVKTKRLSSTEAEGVLNRITAQLDYTGLTEVDVVVEAVVENLTIKHSVLSEVENLVRPDTIIASNTSSLRIDDLARPLRRPENFIGMHFFNPVPSMPLVEIIRGSKSSDTAASTVVGYALKMGKTPIVVKDGPGFLVNRIFTPYMLAASRLIVDGADFVKIDEAMEAFGWPMGPNYLNDVIGMDTAQHVVQLITAGFPERMKVTWTDTVALMAQMGRLGQKSGVGFYRYVKNGLGRPERSIATDSYSVLASVQKSGPREFSQQEIIERMMLPMIIEAAHALEDGTVGSPAELDMALLLGLGCPGYLGGALKYADWLGPEAVLALSARYSSLGSMYHATSSMQAMASKGGRFYDA
jgi:3-hydroxyacyl-CoA dehydrogenase / enoyl-CoA hydratase / 3-hydroxybutyryl-CoA epimerase / enoyl-CoA isomerase